MEQWKTVKITYYKGNNINSIWEVSDNGNIRKNGVLIEPKPFNLNPKYLVCRLGLVHRVVAKAFIPNPENKPCIDHIDGNTRNNNVNNLKWATYKENSNNPISKQRLSDSMKKRYETTSVWNKGKTGVYSKETLEKISKSKKGVKRTTPIWNKGLKNCYSEETIKKQQASRKKTMAQWSEEYRKEVYNKVSEKNKGNTAVKGYIHINNGKQAKMIKKEELDKYLELGYKRGRLLNKSK